MNKKANKKVGVKDIAALAGVSTGTVDRVLHNRGEVKEETRQKVMDIVEELGYKPNVFARSLASKKTTRIAIVIPDSSDDNPYWVKPVVGIKKATNELGTYNIEIIYKHFDASSEASFKNVLSEVCMNMPDGIVLNPVFKAATLHFISKFSEHDVPYVFIDVNINGVGKLAYFGQDAEQSGVVSARIMCNSMPINGKVLIVKQSKSKVFSQHINSRVQGFCSYIANNKKNIVVDTVEIDLEKKNEPNFSLSQVTEKQSYNGFFVPNSRVFKVADFIKTKGFENITIVGYDLIEQNLEHLRNDRISYLISQKPEDQAYNALKALFEFLILKQEVPKTTYSPIDIIIKENIDYYN